MATAAIGGGVRAMKEKRSGLPAVVDPAIRDNMDGRRSWCRADELGEPTSWANYHDRLTVVRASQLGRADDPSIPETLARRKEISNGFVKTRIAQGNRYSAILLV